MSVSNRWLSFSSFRLFLCCLCSVIFLYFWILSLTIGLVNRVRKKCEKESYFYNQTLVKHKLAQGLFYRRYCRKNFDYCERLVWATQEKWLVTLLTVTSWREIMAPWLILQNPLDLCNMKMSNFADFNTICKNNLFRHKKWIHYNVILQLVN